VTRILNPARQGALRRLVLHVALLICVIAVASASSIASVSGSQTPDEGAGTPVALESTTSLSDTNDGTTGETQVGSAEATPTSTSTSSTTETTSNGTDPNNQTSTNLEEGGDTGTGAQTGDTGTGAQTSESSSATPQAEASPVADDVDTAAEPVLHTVTVTVYNCETDPGDTPQTHPDCTVVEAAGVVVQVDATEVGNQPTDAAGQTSFDLEEGKTASFSQTADTITDGFSPRGDGVIDLLIEGASAVNLINLADLEDQGRFQLSNQQCYTSEEPHTEFLPVIGPMVRAASADCIGPLPGAEYTVTGGTLTEPLVLTADSGGGWTGYLDPGDYTIARNGASTGFTIVINQITVVLTVDYVTGIKGTFAVTRYTCSEGASSGTVISIHDGGGGAPPNESCVPSEANVQLFAAGSSADPLNLNGNGTEVEVAVGDYVVRDISTVQHNVSIAAGGYVQALIVETRLTGVVTAQINLCADPSSNFEDPTRPGYWANNCDPAAPGTYVALLDTAGNVLTSTEASNDGSVYFDDILAGVYILDIEEACALFADGADARAGFTVAPNQTVNIAAYGCAKPSNPNPPGGGSQNGGDPPGGDSGSVGQLPDQLFSIGDTNANAVPQQSPELLVTTLPNIGTGQPVSNSLWAAILLLAAILGFAAFRTARPARRTLPVRSRRR
jgi:hypothetical protein